MRTWKFIMDELLNAIWYTHVYANLVYRRLFDFMADS